MATTWAATADNEAVSFGALQDAVNIGYFQLITPFYEPYTKEVTKILASNYVYIDTSYWQFANKLNNQVVVKTNLLPLGYAPPPPPSTQLYYLVDMRRECIAGIENTVRAFVALPTSFTPTLYGWYRDSQGTCTYAYRISDITPTDPGGFGYASVEPVTYDSATYCCGGKLCFQ
jgi:hypothetical protein